MVARIKKCFLLFMIILGISSLQSQPKNIAILKFNSANISSDEVGILTDRLSTELVNLGAFTVIERSQMEEVLKEQGFQQSGCTTNECAVEVGRLVGVQQMVTGSIGKIGSIYTISARLIDVETGELISQYSLDCACPIETILTESMAEIAQKLGAGRQDSQPVVEVPKLGSVEFTSNEEGVELFQNNVSIGITPITLENQDIGDYTYSARKIGFRDKSGSYNIQPGERATVNINISRTEGTLSIEAGRPGQRFDLLVDNQSFSNISSKTLKLPVGGYDLTIKEYGYYDLYKSVLIEDRKINFCIYVIFR